MRDAAEKGIMAWGENQGHSRLTESQVYEIRRRYAAGGVFQEELAREFHVARSQISHIVNRRQWAHLL
jgi:predicted XRE-type DNA-binding protein